VPRGAAAAVPWANFPSILALPLADYDGERQPVLKLHRLCDAGEILVRFCVTLALGELRQLNPELPPRVVAVLQEHIERPTFGRWLAMLRALLEHLTPALPLLVPELPAFVNKTLLPAMGGTGDGIGRADKESGEDPERNLIDLRNLLCHGGAMRAEVAEHYLDKVGPAGEGGWRRWLHETAQKGAFLAEAAVVYFDGQLARRLETSSDGTGLGRELPLSQGLRHALTVRLLGGHVLLLAGERWLDLWPLSDFGRARMAAHRRAPEAQAPAPLVYFRAEPARLLYAALAGDLPQSERADVVAEFRALFKLDAPQARTATTRDYDEDLRLDAAALVGRRLDLEYALPRLKQARRGLFWIGGPGGIGKSFFLARLATDPKFTSDPQKLTCIAWRFRAGDHGRCNREAFLRHAVGRLAEWPPLGRSGLEPAVDPSALRQQFRGLLEDVGRLSGGPHPQARPPRVLFFLDGLEQIAHREPDFPELVLEMERDNVVVVCAGRPSPELQAFTGDPRCVPLFARTPDNPGGGLPPMSAEDIRGMLLDGTGAIKYEVLRLDRDTGQGASNEAVDAVVASARGLPLYVHFVEQDILSGHFTVAELSRRLPPGLEDYYDDLLRRLDVDDLHGLLTPLVITLAWAKSPLEEEVLVRLLQGRALSRDFALARKLLHQGLDAVEAMVRAVALPGGGIGYEPYHLTFRDHVREDRRQRCATQAELAREGFAQLAVGWGGLAAGHPARLYGLRYGPAHLRENGARAELSDLARAADFLAAQGRELPDEPDAALGTVRQALEAAAGAEDAAAMAEFALRHAAQIVALRRQSPLEALQAGSLERARRLADRADPERRVLWCLLLVWELEEQEQHEEARELGSALWRADVPTLAGWMGDYAAQVLAHALRVWPDRLADLGERLLNPEGRAVLSRTLAAGGCVKEALAIAERIGPDGARARALTDIAAAQASGGEEEARATFARAAQAAEQVRNPYSRARALAAAAAAQARAGQIAEALLAVARIGNEGIQAGARAEIAVAQAWAGQVEAALQAAEQIATGPLRAEVLAETAGAEARAGRIEAALQSAGRIDHEPERARALALIAAAQAAAGQAEAAHATFARALEATEPITGEAARAEALAKVAAVLARAGQVESALRAADCIGPYADSRVAALVEVAAAQGRAGEAAAARAIFARAVPLAQGIGDEALRAGALAEIAAAQARAELGHAARATLAGALQPTERGGDEPERAGALATVAGAQADAESARVTFARALQVAEGSGNDYTRAAALARVAAALARAGQFEPALAAAERIVAYEDSRAGALTDIAAAQARAGQMEAARVSFARALRSAARIGYAPERLRTLAEIAGAQARAGLEGAHATLARALEAAERAGDEATRDGALAKIAVAQARAGQIEPALAVAERIGNEAIRAEALAAVAFARARAGQIEPALAVAARIGKEAIKAEALAEVAGAQARAGQIDLALQAAERLAFDGAQARALAEIAGAQARVGPPEAARATFARALEAAERLGDEGARAHALMEIARAQVQAGFGLGAVRTADRILKDAERHLPALAECLREAGDVEHCRQLLLPCAQHVPSAWRFVGALARLYPAQATAIAAVVCGWEEG